MSQNPKSVFNVLLEIENSIPVEQLRLFEIDAWPYMRINLVKSFHGSNRKQQTQKAGHFKRIFNKLLELPIGLYKLILLFIFDRKNNEALKEQRDVLFLTNSKAKRIRLDEGWYDVFTDPIIEHLGQKELSHAVLESSQKLDFKWPRNTKTKLIAPGMVLLYLKSLFITPFKETPNDFNIVFNQYCQVLRSKGLEKHIMNKSDLKREMLFTHLLSKYFQKQIKKINPKLAFVVSYYGYAGMAFCYACRKLGIKSVDIQHGVQGQHHPAYGSFFKFPPSGYNTMPELFLNWTTQDSMNINSWAKHTTNIRAYTSGNPILQAFYGETEIAAFFDTVYNNVFNESQKKVLITLQGFGIQESFLRLIEAFSTKVFFHVRMHPNTPSFEKRKIKRSLNNLNCSNYEVEKSTDLPLYCLLRNIHFHITEYSSVVIEAADFNVKSAIVSRQGLLYYQEYVNKKLAVYCSGFNELKNELAELDTQPPKELASTHSNEEFSKTLNKLLKDHFLQTLAE